MTLFGVGLSGGGFKTKDDMCDMGKRVQNIDFGSDILFERSLTVIPSNSNAMWNELDRIEIFLGWTEFGPWSTCDAGCGGGKRKRERECLAKDKWTCGGLAVEDEDCNIQTCVGMYFS